MIAAAGTPLTVTLASGVRVCVPDSVNHMTPYVLLEQEDWFEDETAFVRSFLLPGMRVLDVGANHGAYTLQAAARVGPTGKVWAFEPAPKTAAFLRQSLAENGFSQVTLVEAALADRDGEGLLRVEDNSELSALAEEGTPVEVRSLDGCAESLGITDVDLVKLDAEGAETKILAGGDGVFMLQSPLVLFELVHGDRVDTDLVDRFVELGYRIYRLAPGPGLLVPFSRGASDGFQLNLFACKPDRALELEGRGLLATVPGGAERAAVWRKHLPTLAYGRRLAARWDTCHQGESWEAYALGLNRAILAHDPSVLPAARALHLAAARTGLGALCVNAGTPARQMTLARVAWALGHRQHALEVLARLSEELTGEVELDEPFLAPCPRFDRVDPGERVADWCLAAVLEQTERLGHFSSYFTLTQTLSRLDRLAELGFPSAEMERRRHLIRLRTGEAGPAPALLTKDGPDHHNAEFFRRASG